MLVVCVEFLSLIEFYTLSVLVNKHVLEDTGWLAHSYLNLQIRLDILGVYPNFTRYCPGTVYSSGIF